MADTALNAYLAMEAIGSPYEAARLGAPVNGLEPAANDTSDDPDAYGGDLTTLHAKLIRWFEAAERGSLDAREASEKARDYFDCKQWTRAESEALRLRGQPELTINYVKRKVELLCGLERKARTDPKAFSRTPSEDDRATAATQALRYISDDNRLSTLRSAVFQHMLVEGYGGVSMGLVDDGKGGVKIKIAGVPWDRLFHDPHSTALDFSDARYLGLVIWMDRDQQEDMFPDAGDVIEDSFDNSSGTYDDRPGAIAWQDTQRQRTRIVQIHWVEAGEWWGATMNKAGFLTEPQRSVWLDANGDSACGLILQAAYVDRDNARYGMVRDLISLQDEINKRRSKALHLLSVNRAIAEKGAVEDVDKARREMARPDGYIEITPGMRFDAVPAGDLAMGQLQLLKHATEEMQASGPNASMAGNDPRELSGRAILAQQAGGAVQNEPLADALRQWTRRVMETCWMAARQYWTEERWVRITDDLGSKKWVGLNRQITLADELKAMPDDQRAMAMQNMQLQPGDPRLQQVIRIENELHDLEVDIEIEEGIDVPAMEVETFQTLVQMASLQPGIIPPDVLIAASPIKNKDDLLERMKQHQQEQAPIQQASQAADVQVKQAKAAADMALAKEREHAVVRNVAEVHRMHHEMHAPGEPAAAELPPQLMAAQALADIRQKNTAADVNQAKVVHTLAQAKATLHPPKPPAKPV